MARGCARVAIEHRRALPIACLRLEPLPLDNRDKQLAHPVQRRAARVRNSRRCPPEALAASPVSPCAAYASMNSCASSMVSQRRTKPLRGSFGSVGSFISVRIVRNVRIVQA